jgi:hypothetical protein
MDDNGAMEADVKNAESDACPECGAPKVDGLSCREQLGVIGAWEWQDPALLALHFLTVASYNLQHPAQFTDAAIDSLRELFIAHFDQGMAVAEVRRRVAQSTAGSVKVLKPEAERRPVLRHWSMTIADVYTPGQPEGAAERVKAWAASIHTELAT